jgi:hypothetical protein
VPRAGTGQICAQTVPAAETTGILTIIGKEI